MRNCIVTGHLGFIGRNLLKDARLGESFEKVYLTDVNTHDLKLDFEHEVISCDLNDLNSTDFSFKNVYCIIHLAAVCREPGYTREEYFRSNYDATTAICKLADKVGCNTIFFTSSMAVYGPTRFQASEEDHPLAPYAHYGASKLTAEWVLKEWQSKSENRKLVICRPGVIYGPDDVHNIPRMIKAVKKGYFLLPSGINVYKSYGYVKGLIDSIFFTLAKDSKFILYNYVENESYTVFELAKLIQKKLGVTKPILRLPYGFLMLFAKMATAVTFGKSPLHPVRVQKIATSTHLKPQKLLDLGFEFKWGFEKSLDDWFEEDPRFSK